MLVKSALVSQDSPGSANSAVKPWYGATDVDAALLVSCSRQMCVCVSVSSTVILLMKNCCVPVIEKRAEIQQTESKHSHLLPPVRLSLLVIAVETGVMEMENWGWRICSVDMQTQTRIRTHPPFEEYHWFIHKKPVCWVTALHWHFQYSEAAVRNLTLLCLSCSCWFYASVPVFVYVPTSIR